MCIDGKTYPTKRAGPVVNREKAKQKHSTSGQPMGKLVCNLGQNFYNVQISG